MQAPTLSILTPAVWSRLDAAQALAAEIRRQAAAFPHGAVEHLVLFDDRTLSVGAKRQALADSATGGHIAFVDDDDWVAPDYVADLLAACAPNPDVITFRQAAVIDGVEGEIVFGAGHPDEPWVAGGVARRGPWHVCAWRREAVAGCLFELSNYGEDFAWVRQARGRIRFHAHIDKILHTYRHDATTTCAPPPGR